MSSIEITSLADPTEIRINLLNSAFDNLIGPSARFSKIEVAALLSCEANSNLSCLGKEAANL